MKGFKEHCRAGLRNHFVYRVYDVDDEVIYVGFTRKPETRWKAHRWQSRDMVAEAAYCRMAGPYDYPTARRIEALQIHQFQPYYNSYGTGYLEAPA
jgi:excinuclease UvrABC nuclease subunit